MPMRPDGARNATRFSPRRRARSGGPSGAGSSRLMRTGSQYWRRRSPIGVPGPTRQRSSLSWALSIGHLASLSRSVRENASRPAPKIKSLVAKARVDHQVVLTVGGDVALEAEEQLRHRSLFGEGA